MEDILAPLNEVQKEVVTYCDGPILVLAGAGSGKTRAVTHKIAWLLRERRMLPYQVLAVTFTNKAAGEMRDRLHKLVGPPAEGLEAGTFHSVCAKWLRRHAGLLGYSSSYTIYDGDDSQSLMRHVVKDQKLDPKKFNARSLLSAYESLRNDCEDVEAWALDRMGRDSWRGMASRLFQDYEKRKRSLNAMDFTDLLFRMYEVLRDHEEVRTQYHERFQYVLVDEMQDTNHLQFELLRLLVGPHTRICAVGDDDQSIYGWRGARVENMLDFEKAFPGARIMRMEQNYRSTGTIIAAANGVIVHNRRRHVKKLWTGNDAGESLALFHADSEGDEAARIARRIAALHGQGTPYRQMAVFFRTNAQSRSFEELLGRENVPYVLVGGLRFYERAEVKDALAYLRILHNPKDEVSFNRIINNPPRGIGATALERLALLAHERDCSLYEAGLSLAQQQELPDRGAAAIAAAIRQLEGWRAAAGKLSAAALARQVLEDSGYVGRLGGMDRAEAEARLGNLEQLVAGMTEYEVRSGDNGLQGYLEHVSLITDVDLWKSEKDRVPLMTVHAAKGLEFDIVFVTGMEDDLFPHESHSDNQELEEERRLFYVALTRARKKVFLSHARSRFRYGGTTYPLPSRFLAEIPRANVVSEDERPRRSFRDLAREPLHGGQAGPAPSERRPAQPPAPVAPASAGRRVQHKTHGPGTVLALIAHTKVPLAVVRFDSGSLVTVRADSLQSAEGP